MVYLCILYNKFDPNVRLYFRHYIGQFLLEKKITKIRDVTDVCLIYLVANSLSRSVNEFYRTINLKIQTKWH